MANLTDDHACIDKFGKVNLMVDDEDDYLPLPLVILFAIPASVIILLTVFGNMLVLLFKARVGRTNTTLLVWNLGLTDFLVGIFVLPLGAIHLIKRHWGFGRFMCRMWVATDVTFCTCSVVTICTISIDRYFAVTRPLRYKMFVTKMRVIIVIIAIWTFSSTILLSTVRWDQPDCVEQESICFAGNEIRYLAHSVVLAFFFPATVTLTLYWKIYRLARNRQRALDKGFLMVLGQNMNFLTNTLTSAQNTTLRVHFGKNNGMVEHQRRVLRTHERIAKTLGVVSCSFLFCWLPFFILYLTNFQCKCIPSMAIDISSWLGYCNSMINPIIYSFTVKEFKRSALRMLLPLWRVVYRFLPFLVGRPPEHITLRMSRTGHRAKAKQKTYDVAKNRMISSTRRMTAPAVFTVNKLEKEMLKKDPIIEEVEVEEDSTATRHFTTDIDDLRPVPTTHSDTNHNRKSSAYSARNSFRCEVRAGNCLMLQNGYRKPPNGVRKASDSTKPVLASNGKPATVQCNGSTPKDGGDSACSVTVYCVTNEMTV